MMWYIEYWYWLASEQTWVPSVVPYDSEIDAKGIAALERSLYKGTHRVVRVTGPHKWPSPPSKAGDETKPDENDYKIALEISQAVRTDLLQHREREN